jgi:hypothetical protein
MSPLTKEEKLQIFNNDRSVYLHHAQAAANDVGGGRFKKELETRVTGVPEYPKLPTNNPWSQADPVPDEPPLGYSVDALEPGTSESGSTKEN